MLQDEDKEMPSPIDRSGDAKAVVTKKLFRRNEYVKEVWSDEVCDEEILDGMIITYSIFDGNIKVFHCYQRFS